MTDIEKLQAYTKAITELNSLIGGFQGELDESENFQHLEILIPPSTKIKEYKWNSDNVITETREFPFSVIQDVTSRIKKKIVYRKEKLSTKNIVEENNSEK